MERSSINYLNLISKWKLSKFSIGVKWTQNNFENVSSPSRRMRIMFRGFEKSLVIVVVVSNFVNWKILNIFFDHNADSNVVFFVTVTLAMVKNGRNRTIFDWNKFPHDVFYLRKNKIILKLCAMWTGGEKNYNCEINFCFIINCS